MPWRAAFKTLVAVFLAFASCFVLPAAETQENKVRIELFHQTGCKECELIKRLVLPGVEERFKGRYGLILLDIGVKENFLKLAEYQESLGIKSNDAVTMIVQGKTALCGYKEISAKLADAIDDAIAGLGDGNSAIAKAASVQQEKPAASALILQKRAERMTFAAVMLAGIIDCFNPCAFSTLVLFMSILSVSKIGGRKLLAVGAIYCMAAFITYTALGFGLFHCIKALNSFQTLQTTFNWSMAGLLIALAGLSFKDAWSYARGGRPENISVQLPGRLKSLVHSTMRTGVKFHHLAVGSAMVGVLVTLIESVCTGQVYIPTLAMLAKGSPAPAKWISLILLYNAMFTIPLILLFIAAYLGTGTPRLLDWSKRNVVPSKVSMGLLFLALAALIVFV